MIHFLQGQYRHGGLCHRLIVRQKMPYCCRKIQMAFCSIAFQPFHIANNKACKNNSKQLGIVTLFKACKKTLHM